MVFYLRNSTKMVSKWELKLFRTTMVEGLGLTLVGFRVLGLGFREPYSLESSQRAILDSKCFRWMVTSKRMSVLGGSGGLSK